MTSTWGAGLKAGVALDGLAPLAAVDEVVGRRRARLPQGVPPSPTRISNTLHQIVGRRRARLPQGIPPSPTRISNTPHQIVGRRRARLPRCRRRRLRLYGGGGGTVAGVVYTGTTRL